MKSCIECAVFEVRFIDLSVRLIQLHQAVSPPTRTAITIAPTTTIITDIAIDVDIAIVTRVTAIAIVPPPAAVTAATARNGF